MAQCASDANGSQTVSFVEETLHSQDRVVLEQHKRHSGIVQVYPALSQLPNQPSGKSVHIDFKSQRQCASRTQSRSHTTELSTFDCLVKPEHVTPKSLVAESVEAEAFPALAEQSVGVTFNNSVEIEKSKNLGPAYTGDN
jgi:hypothetical protein